MLFSSVSILTQLVEFFLFLFQFQLPLPDVEIQRNIIIALAVIELQRRFLEPLCKDLFLCLQKFLVLSLSVVAIQVKGHPDWQHNPSTKHHWFPVCHFLVLHRFICVVKLVSQVLFLERTVVVPTVFVVFLICCVSWALHVLVVLRKVLLRCRFVEVWVLQRKVVHLTTGHVFQRFVSFHYLFEFILIKFTHFFINNVIIYYYYFIFDEYYYSFSS